jgi:peptidoglycan/xylan/chitin deacetylase (PgdA/CDA1 family)
VSTGPPALAEPTTSYVAPTLHVEPAAYTWQAPNGTLPGDRKEIALTFDDGPSPYTPQVLAVLERYHVPATFFEIGEWVAVYPQYTRELVAAGYPVENHTWSHPDLATIPAVQVAYQVARAQDEIRSVTGQSPACVRPPYDDWDTTVLDQIASDGLTTMSYSVDSRDWALPGTQAIVDRVLGAAFPGAVVDMHDGGGPRYETVEALPQIITGLWAKGYTFVAICGAHRPSASTLPAPHAVVLSVRATPGTLAAGGGTVAVTGRVEHASSCQLQLLSRQSFPVVYSHNPTSACHDGNYSAHVTIGANPTPVPRVVAFGLIARNSTSGFTGRFYVLLAAAPRPLSSQPAPRRGH